MLNNVVMNRILILLVFVFALGASTQAQVKTIMVSDETVLKAKPSIYASDLKGLQLKPGDVLLVYEYFEEDFPFWSAKVGMNEFYIEDADIKQTSGVIAQKKLSVNNRKERQKFLAKIKTESPGR